jgi:hypothetical protein
MYNSLGWDLGKLLLLYKNPYASGSKHKILYKYFIINIIKYFVYLIYLQKYILRKFVFQSGRSGFENIRGGFQLFTGTGIGNILNIVIIFQNSLQEKIIYLRTKQNKEKKDNK